jgi:hypothetical protein
MSSSENSKLTNYPFFDQADVTRTSQDPWRGTAHDLENR